MPARFTHPSAWKSREQRRSNQTVVSGLHHTHSFLEADNPIPVSDAFADRDRPITVECEITITTTSPNGIVWEMGGGTGGMAVAVSNNFAAVYAGETGDDGVVALASTLPNVAGTKVKLVAAVDPGTGRAWLWINGKIAARGTSVNGALSNGWGTSQDGAVADIETSTHPDIPGPQAVALANATVNGRVRVYDGFLPKNLSS